MGSPFTPGSSHSPKLQNRLRKEKQNLSYADLHSEVMNDVNIVPPASGLHKKEHARSKAIEKEELVKYMSKLPSYLQKGEKVEAKPLSIGVLDWHTVENWQNYHPQRVSRSGRSSISSSITSSSLWTDGSSNRYRRGESCSPCGRKGRRPTLQSYLNISPAEGHFEFVKSSAGNASKFPDETTGPSNPSDRRQNIPKEYQYFETKSSEIKLRESKKQNIDQKNFSETRTSRYCESYGALSSSKGKLKVQDDASEKEPEKLRDQYDKSIRNDSPDRLKDVVLLLPRDGAGSKLSAESRPFDLTQRNDQETTGFSQMSSKGFHFEGIYRKEPSSRTSNSSPLLRKVDDIKEPQMETKICSPSSAIESFSRARNKNLKEKSMMSLNSTPTKSLRGLDMKRGAVSDTEVRNPSPTYRFRMILDRVSRSSNSKDSAAVPQFSSKDVNAISGPERADASVCSRNSTSDKHTAVSRDRSSPLRRLLDPLLKPKLANSKFAQQSQRDSGSIHRPSTSYDGKQESSCGCPVKVKLDFTSLRAPKLDDPHQNEMQGPAKVQAYLQVAVKNGLPLFTFAVDNSIVLAATLRKFSSRKDDPTCIYTFFIIQEFKKKNGGWLSHGSKGKEYVPNVVAQMKVSDLPTSSWLDHHSSDQLNTREFVLYAVDLRPFDQQTSDIQPNDELAAIVVQFPRKPVIGLKELPLYIRNSSDGRNLQEHGLSVGSREHFSTTVILPGAVHGLPSDGEPSSLVERWLTGGQCDCGGWDLGCKVKVLGNQRQKPTGQFELFLQSQDEVLKSLPFFSLCSLKNGIFSVEFDSSVSFLQAFSICIAVLDSRTPSELPQQSKLFEERLAEEKTLLDSYGVKTPKHVQVDVPVGYTSPPPNSPVGRV